MNARLKYLEKTREYIADNDLILSKTSKKYNEDTNFEIVNEYLEKNPILIDHDEKSITIKLPYKIGLTTVKFKFSIIYHKTMDFSLEYSHKHTQEMSYLYFDHFPAMDDGFFSKNVFDSHAAKYCPDEINKNIFEWIDILLQHFFRNQFKELNKS